MATIYLHPRWCSDPDAIRAAERRYGRKAVIDPKRNGRVILTEMRQGTLDRLRLRPRRAPTPPKGAA